MLLAYLTTDEVNGDLAVRMAEAHGITLYSLSFQEKPLDGQFDAVVYDWDHLPVEHRQEILLHLLWSPVPCPVGLHSYNLDDEQAEALRQNGVTVFFRLDPALFLVLNQAHLALEEAKERRRNDLSGIGS